MGKENSSSMNPDCSKKQGAQSGGRATMYGGKHSDDTCKIHSHAQVRLENL